MGISREYRPPIPVPKFGNGIFHSHSRSRKWEWNFMEFSFPFPKMGVEFAISRSRSPKVIPAHGCVVNARRHFVAKGSAQFLLGLKWSEPDPSQHIHSSYRSSLN